MTGQPRKIDDAGSRRREGPEGAPSGAAAPVPPSTPTVGDPSPPDEDPLLVERRLRYVTLLEEFRRTPVLVPLGDTEGPVDERGMLTADLNGVRFILAFSDEQALARYAQARGEFHREWTYQTVLGSRLLDAAVPAAGTACGVALDCADGPDGAVFPPVQGIVPIEAAVDADWPGRSNR
ncbi:hypothetical protein ABZS84_27895 [Streptomyces sp. NPDC005481]|uniref:hypothetical protein n=1 Tax=unclassified Streptomyces TaxID=2593676 RepID=UPI0033AC0445